MDQDYRKVLLADILYRDVYMELPLVEKRERHLYSELEF